MFKRKLLALDYHSATTFKVDDENEFRNLLVWLEDQKIRHYKIEDRQALRNLQASNWEEALQKYLTDLDCPVDRSQRPACLDWLLGCAVRLEYGDSADKYRNVSASSVTSKPASDQSTNPLANIDFDAADFKAGVASLSQLLQIPPHSDHALVLQAVSLLVKEKLSKEVTERAQKDQATGKKHTIPLDKVDLGFETGDYISAEAAKILRLLHIRELRDLQDQINMAIVKVQALVANPKTDSRLGKVGRF